MDNEIELDRGGTTASSQKHEASQSVMKSECYGEAKKELNCWEVRRTKEGKGYGESKSDTEVRDKVSIMPEQFSKMNKNRKTGRHSQRHRCLSSRLLARDF